MRQLTSLDVQFLAVEDERTHGHVGSIAVYDPSTAPGGALTLDDLKALLRERIHLLPPFTWRLVRVPFDLDHPYWAEDPDFELDYHVRELALPAPGDLRQLAEQSARIFERKLDRDRPLWEMYLIQGIERGTKVGLLTKIHHAALDGLSGAEVLVTLLDLEPSGREIPPPSGRRPAPLPGTLELAARGLIGLPRHTLRALRDAPRTLPNLDLVPTVRSMPGVNTLAGTARRVSSLLPGHEAEANVPRLLAPKTILNRKVTGHRRVSFETISLSEVKAVKNALGVTVNDVVVALTAGTVRDWLIAHGDLPDDPLLAMVPVSVRLPEEFGTFGNRVSMMVVPIPTAEADPLQRVRLAHRWLAEAKARHDLTPRMLIEEANEAIPPIAMHQTARMLLNVAASGRLNPPLNVVISNVPGSPVPLYLAGARLEAQYPLSVITDGMGLNLTILSYLDRIDFGIVADRSAVPDIWFVAERIRAGFEELKGALPAKAKAKPTRAKRAKAAPKTTARGEPEANGKAGAGAGAARRRKRETQA